MTAFLLTWKTWSHDELLAVVQRCERDGYADEHWRLISSKRAQAGDRVWLLKQGGDYGIFGVGMVTGPSEQRPDENGDLKRYSPIRFTRMVDPLAGRFLISPEQTANVLTKQQLGAPASGFRIQDERSAELEELLEGNLRGNTGSAWARWEIVAIVDGYLSMLAEELAARPYSKTAHRNALREAIPLRSDGSIERKHQNISAVLQDLGLRWIVGYKPLSNYQQMLRDVLEASITRLGLDSLQPVSTDIDPNLIFVDPPTPVASKPSTEKKKRIGRKTDRAALDAKNRTLGEAGERYVMDVEKARLTAAGRADLAAKLEWTSKQVGDGMGYDIASYEVDGSPLHIEVKTTGGPIDTPFYLTSAEIEASAELGKTYRLYRVFGFPQEKRVYQLKGHLRACEPRLGLFAISYRASILGAVGTDEVAISEPEAAARVS
jgi:hypothetical protein